ncbi:flagellar hook protein FlgE [Metapseudomonas boanensis]|uniref:Flagellar hook protein FlgE n=1 Tax=Metapseudomonas boanensis TaxID=2822138 RepID=A0ABS5XFJ0_9GAMM|nr:flagellar hook protein FlgE [Pseudomonas boanensis]MBT8766456.1 flagellar hook protein FlgE [Pseudomonas boanensis]
MSFNNGLSGLRSASTDLNITGNNIANAGTVGFKQSRAEFANIYASSVLGGGKNPQGSGSLLSSVSQQFNQGNINYTQNALDLAINGNGFFQVSNNGALSYTRAGYFGTDSNGYIVDNFGYNLQGYTTDDNGVLQTGSIGNLRIRATSQAPAATSIVTQGFNLNSTSTVPTNAFSPTDPTSYNSSTSTNIFDSQGNAHVMTQFFVKTAPNAWTMNVLIDGSHPLAGVANLAASTAASAAGATPASVATAVATLAGTDPSVLPAQVTAASAASVAAGATVESVVAAIAAAGKTPVSANMTFNSVGQLQPVTSTSPAAYDPNAVPAMPAPQPTDVWEMNADGTLKIRSWVPSTSNGEENPVFLANGAAISNSGVSLDFRQATQFASAFAVNSVAQDGYTTGELAGVEISDQGEIFARYTNGQSRVQGQVILANFANVQGLTPVGKSQWIQAADSGEPVRNPPRSGTLGAIQSGALEDSNVDLSDQLVNLIVAQRNYQASAKTIEAESALTQTVINLR